MRHSLCPCIEWYKSDIIGDLGVEHRTKLKRANALPITCNAHEIQNIYAAHKLTAANKSLLRTRQPVTVRRKALRQSIPIARLSGSRGGESREISHSLSQKDLSPDRVNAGDIKFSEHSEKISSARLKTPNLVVLVHVSAKKQRIFMAPIGKSGKIYICKLTAYVIYVRRLEALFFVRPGFKEGRNARSKIKTALPLKFLNIRKIVRVDHLRLVREHSKDRLAEKIAHPALIALVSNSNKFVNSALVCQLRQVARPLGHNVDVCRAVCLSNKIKTRALSIHKSRDDQNGVCHTKLSRCRQSIPRRQQNGHLFNLLRSRLGKIFNHLTASRTRRPAALVIEPSNHSKALRSFYRISDKVKKLLREIFRLEFGRHIDRTKLIRLR